MTSNSSSSRIPRVLSIQSWVSHGYVGNKCAVMALQHMGIDVDPINTVQLSNNTAYSTWKGESLSSTKLLEIFDALLINNITDQYTHVLTGYNNNSSTLRAVIEIVKKLKQLNHPIIYVCDPVLGDNNALYVPAELVDIYKNEVIPYADYLFPNQTELEFLTGTKIHTINDAILAIDILHSVGIKNIVITSLTVSDEDHKDGDGVGSNSTSAATILVIGSQMTTQDEPKKRFKIQVPKFNGYYTGTGDLFSALLLGWSTKEQDLKLICERSVSTLHKVIKLTHESKQIEQQQGNLLLKGGIEYYELRIIQSRQFINDNPLIEPLFRATPL